MEVMKICRGLTVAILVASLSACATRPPAAGIPADDSTTAQLRSLRGDLFKAIDQGDRPALERLLAPGFMFIHSTGVLETRQQFIDRSVAAAATSKGPPPPELVFADEQIRMYGSTAIWTTRSTRPSTGKSPEQNFRGTDVLMKISAGWQWASVHSTRLATRPKAIELPARTLQSYVGEYRSADKKLVISAEANALFADLTNYRRAELVPQAEAVFAWFDRDSNLESRLTIERSTGPGEMYAVLSRDGRELFRGIKADSSR